MSTFTVPYEHILRQAVELTGRAFVDSDGQYVLHLEEQALFRTAINRAVSRIQGKYPWPELKLTERRTFAQPYTGSGSDHFAPGDVRYFRATQQYYQALEDYSTAGMIQPASKDNDGNWVTNTACWFQVSHEYSASEWSATTAYGSGDQVYYPLTEKFYVAKNATTGDLPTDTNHWVETPTFTRLIESAQSWETNEIGTMLGMFEEDPDADSNAPKVDFFRRQDHFVVVDQSLPFVYAVFRTPNPGALDESYSIHKRFEGFVPLYAASIILRMDGKPELAAAMSDEAERALLEAIDEVSMQEANDAKVRFGE